MVEGVVHQEGSELLWGLAVRQVEEDFHRVKVVVGVLKLRSPKKWVWQSRT